MKTVLDLHWFLRVALLAFGFLVLAILGKPIEAHNSGQFAAEVDIIQDENAIPLLITQTPTPAPLKLQYKVGDTSASDNQISNHIQLVNDGSTSASLEGITVRYWFTDESSQDNTTYYCDYAVMDCSHVSGSYVALPSLVDGADGYLELAFNNAPAIPANGNSGVIQSRFAKADWSNYDESNDYSYNPNQTTLADYDYITVHSNGQLISGVAPLEPTPTPTPTWEPTPTWTQDSHLEVIVSDTEVEVGETFDIAINVVDLGTCTYHLLDVTITPNLVTPDYIYQDSSWRDGGTFIATETGSTSISVSGYGEYQCSPQHWTWGYVNGSSETVTIVEASGPITPTATATFTPTPTDTPTVTPTFTPTPATSSSCSVAYALNDWGSGFTADITITNNDSSPVEGYTLTWDYDGNQQMTGQWNATIVQDGSSFAASNVASAWNGTLAANGGASTFGFNADYSGSNDIPTQFILNGVVCNDNDNDPHSDLAVLQTMNDNLPYGSTVPYVAVEPSPSTVGVYRAVYPIMVGADDSAEISHYPSVEEAELAFAASCSGNDQFHGLPSCEVLSNVHFSGSHYQDYRSITWLSGTHIYKTATEYASTINYNAADPRYIAEPLYEAAVSHGLIN